jgi:hydroxypyruvate isomerase
MNRREFHRLLTGAALTPAFLRGNAQTSATGTPSAKPSSGKFRFSVMIWTLERGHSLSAEQCIDIVAQAGYQGVELVDEPKKWTPEETRRIQAKLHKLGLEVDSMAGLRIRLADPTYADKLYSQLEAHISLVKSFGCRQIILTSGHRVEGLSRDQQHAACISNLKHVVDLVEKNDVEIVIEPIDLTEQPMGYLNSVAEGFEIVRAVNSPNIKVLYDFYHEQYQAGDLIVKLENNIDWVGLVHIADVPGRHEPGTGEINYRNIYRKLAELNYNRFVTMEYLPIGDPLQSLKTQRLVALEAIRTPAAPYRLRANI